MVLNTITVGAAVTPTVVKTCANHYLRPKPRRQKPTAHISYDEGLHLIRQFLHYASFHTVEEIQAFTSQWVPIPRWVRVDEVSIPEKSIVEAADAIIEQLGHRGVDKVGGSKWWQWRREGSILKAEWIEMRAEYNRREETGEQCKRVMLYVHGGAFFFGSVDEHRYQMQRHARKLKARVLARFDPSTIVLAGDSAGAGLVVSMLVILRDQGLPLPAGAILISPWVDLTHSFPSVSEVNNLDYIPAHGFIQRPSPAWPPPNADDMEDIARHAVESLVNAGLPRKSTQQERQKATETAINGFSVDHHPTNLYPKSNDNNPAGTEGATVRAGNTIPGPGHDLSILIDGNLVDIKDQIQMYATNQLISHPLVSPVLQPSLGGLPPLLILTGGGEMLRDEQIYLAHKAASPSKYPPGEAYLNEYPEARDIIKKWKPTDVQLQVWDDLCHVAPTLSFTRPAKYMYRSIAQFGAWALARAQKTDIEILDDDDVSVISSESEIEADESEGRIPRQERSVMKDGTVSGGVVTSEQIGKAGDPLPPFKNHMIRQRVDRHGKIYHLSGHHSLPALQISSNDVGVIKPGPVRKWMEAKAVWDSKFAKEKRKVQQDRAIEMAKGYQGFGNDEAPPPTALAGRRGLNIPKVKAAKRSWGMTMWSIWGSKHDEKTIEREQNADKELDTVVASPNDGKEIKSTKRDATRSRSRRRVVSDQGQATEENDSIDENTPADEILYHRQNNGNTGEAAPDQGMLSPSFTPRLHRHVKSFGDTEGGLAPIGTNTTVNSPASTQSNTDGLALPFRLGRTPEGEEENASLLTLTSGMSSQTALADLVDKRLEIVSK